MKVVSLFAGIGGFDLAFEQAGAQVVGQVEIDKFCQRVLKWHYPDVPLWGDVCNVGRRELPAHDVLCGGFPCQDLSVAGKRAGLDGERSGLFYEVVRILTECTPQWFCLENVPGLLSSKGGADFQAVIEALVEIGYGVAWRVLDAQYFGVPQRRRRVFIVGCLGNISSAAKVLFESESLPWDTPPSRKERRETTRGVEFGPSGSSFTELAPTLDTRCKNGPMQNQVGLGVLEAPSVSLCLHASGNDKQDATHQTYVVGYQGSDLGHALRANPSKADKPSSSTYMVQDRMFGNVPCVGVRRLTPTECERLQGFPDGWTAVDGAKDTTRYKAIGNAVAVPVVRWIAERMIGV